MKIRQILKSNARLITALLLTVTLTGLTACNDKDNPVPSTEPVATPGTSTRNYDLNPKIIDAIDYEALTDVFDGVLATTSVLFVVEYTSVGPDLKTPVRLTGGICMPMAVYKYEQKPSCLTIYNQYTTTQHDERLTKFMSFDMDFFTNKTQNQILLTSYLYGWTLTEDKPQAYCCGEVTAIETLDFYDAATQVLYDVGYDLQGLPLINIGYSSGGYSAMAVQRFIDEKRPDLHVTLTAAGGAPFDINTVYHDQVETNTTGYVCSLPLMVVAYKENYHLPFEYTDVFEKPLCDSIQAWILSKDYGTWEINARIGIGKPIDQVMTPAARDFSSPIGQQLGQMFQKNSLCGEGQTWQPSTTTKFLIFHTLKDIYMTWHVAQEMANYLKDKGCTVETYIEDMGDHVDYAMYTFYFESLIRIQQIIDPSNTQYIQVLRVLIEEVKTQKAGD